MGERFTVGLMPASSYSSKKRLNCKEVILNFLIFRNSILLLIYDFVVTWS